MIFLRAAAGALSTNALAGFFPWLDEAGRAFIGHYFGICEAQSRAVRLGLNFELLPGQFRPDPAKEFFCGHIC
jgi:hypothetical protein